MKVLVPLVRILTNHLQHQWGCNQITNPPLMENYPGAIDNAPVDENAVTDYNSSQLQAFFRRGLAARSY